MRLRLLASVALPLGAGILFVLGHTVAGTIVAVVIVLDSAVDWPVLRVCHASQVRRSREADRAP